MDRELFWDQITRERMSEVGNNSPFDLMVRSRYEPESRTLERVRLGSGDDSVEVDIINVDLDSCYLRTYDVDFTPTAGSISGKGLDLGMSDVLGNLENSWSYESSLLVFDEGETYDAPNNGLISGTVYWPEQDSYEPDAAYHDFRRMTGQDILSDL